MLHCKVLYLGVCKVADTYVFIIKLYKTSGLAKDTTSGNVLSIMLTLSFKNSDQQMIGNCDFLNRLSDTDMTDARRIMVVGPWSDHP